MLGSKIMKKMQDMLEWGDGSQFRRRHVEVPSRLSMLKQIQAEEATKDGSKLGMKEKGKRSARLTASVGLNMGLELEMCQ